jgi:CheY-like chemotaxis protein
VADVLIVDDDPDVREQTGMLVELLGHHVRVAPTAEDALVRSVERRPDVMLLDLNLPGIDGDRFLEWLDRGIGRPRRIVIMSARAEPEVSDLARRFDADYVIKPFAPALLRDIVTRAIADVSGDSTFVP